MSTTEQQAKQPAPATAPEEKDAVGDFVDQYPHKVFVGNISFRTTEDQLKEFFASAGTVVQAKVITRGTRSLGYGFVAFEKPEECDAAIEMLSKKELDGREINVEVAKPQTGDHKPYKFRPRRKLRKPKARSGDSGAAAAAPAAEAADKPAAGAETNGTAAETKKKKRKGRSSYKRRNRTATTTNATPAAVSSSEGDQAATTQSNGQAATATTSSNGKSSRRSRLRRKRRPLGEPSKTTIFVANLPFSMDDQGLAALFSDYKVKKATVVKSRPIPKRNLPARSKGFGFVEFETEEEQKRLIESKVKLVAEDRELSIKIALNEDRTSTSETTPATTSETAPATTSEASPGATPEVASATETPATTEPASVASPPPASKPAATEEDPNMVDWS